MIVTPKIFEDAFNLLCGRKIGEGIHRKVFLCSIDPSLVVKIEYETAFWTGSNAAEWRIWNENDLAPAWSRWLAPCILLSPDSRVMLQKRTTPIPDHLIPKKLPSWLCDVKWENFGMFEGRVVAHDYPFVKTTMSNRLVNANWRR